MDAFQVAQNLRMLMAIRGMNQTQLGEVSGVSQSSISRALDPPSADFALRRQTANAIEEALKVPSGSLQNPRAHKSLMQMASGSSVHVPFIPLEQFRGPVDLVLQSFQAAVWYGCPVPHGPGSFVTRIVGDAMDVRQGYADGDLVFIDPTADLHHGDDIVFTDEKEVSFFRRLLLLPEGRFVQALNPKWPDSLKLFPEGGKVVGRAIFSGRARGG